MRANANISLHLIGSSKAILKLRCGSITTRAYVRSFACALFGWGRSIWPWICVLYARGRYDADTCACTHARTHAQITRESIQANAEGRSIKVGIVTVFAKLTDTCALKKAIPRSFADCWLVLSSWLRGTGFSTGHFKGGWKKSNLMGCCLF